MFAFIVYVIISDEFDPCDTGLSEFSKTLDLQEFKYKIISKIQNIPLDFIKKLYFFLLFSFFFMHPFFVFHFFC